VDQPGPLRLVIFGRQGAGKGTQSTLLAEHYGSVHISTGDMLREAVAAGTEFGRKAKEFMDAGQLLPDDVMLGVVEERLQQADVLERGFLLDGFPRTIPQAEALLDLASVDLALDLDVPEDVVLERMSNRRVCENCGRIYSVDDLDGATACAVCGGALVQRDDDRPEAIAKRLKAYAEQTVPTIRWFDDRALLLVVDGLGSPDEVSKRVIDAIDSRLGR
jgi:adenylate kinase